MPQHPGCVLPRRAPPACRHCAPLFPRGGRLGGAAKLHSPPATCLVLMNEVKQPPPSALVCRRCAPASWAPPPSYRASLPSAACSWLRSPATTSPRTSSEEPREDGGASNKTGHSSKGQQRWVHTWQAELQVRGLPAVHRRRSCTALLHTLSTLASALHGWPPLPPSLCTHPSPHPSSLEPWQVGERHRRLHVRG